LGRQFLAEGDYERALKEHEKALSLGGRDTQQAESLFSIGLIYAHPAYPARDYGKSIGSLRRLIDEYPGSSLAEPAKAVMGLLQENERLVQEKEKSLQEKEKSLQEKERTLREKDKSLQENEKLKGTVEKLNIVIDRLNNTIDELKKVDIDVDQKKRERAK